MNNLRPDEQAAYSQIEKSQTRDKQLKSGLKTVATTALAVAAPYAAVSTKLGSKILPLLNEYIPADLAVKGINKISPELGSFLKKGLSKGLPIKEGLDFIKNKIESDKSSEKPTEESKNKNPKENRNIIEQYSPELHRFISEHVSSGRSPVEAGALAKKEEKFKKIIGKLSQDHNTPWASIIDSIYGSGQYGGAVNSQQAPQQVQQQQNPEQQPSQQQSGQGQQALMAILQKINQRMGGTQ